MRKLSLMFIAMLILVVMVFAMTHGTALGQDEPVPVADAKAKEAKAGGAKAECDDGVIEGKAGGVVNKACKPPPPPKALPEGV